MELSLQMAQTVPTELMELTPLMELSQQIAQMAPMEPILVIAQMELNQLMAPMAPMVLTDQTAQTEPRMAPIQLMEQTPLTPLMAQSPQMVLTQPTLLMDLLNGMAHKLHLKILLVIILAIVPAANPLHQNKQTRLSNQHLKMLSKVSMISITL
jgi:hypothetical protein